MGRAEAELVPGRGRAEGLHTSAEIPAAGSAAEAQCLENNRAFRIPLVLFKDVHLSYTSDYYACLHTPISSV